MKKKKKIVLLAVFLLIVAAWGARVYWVNQEYPDVERKTYALQEGSGAWERYYRL